MKTKQFMNNDLQPTYVLHNIKKEKKITLFFNLETLICL